MTQKMSISAIVVIDRLRLRRAAMAALIQPWAASQGLTVVAADPDHPPEVASAEVGVVLALVSLGGGAISDSFNSPLAKLLRALPHELPWVVVSDRSDPAEVAMAERLGLRALLPGNIAPELALQAIGFVLQGGTYFPREAERGARPAACVSDQAPPPGHLTRRQQEVLDGLRSGLSNKGIGRDLDMQESTVKVHVRQIMRKLGAHNRTQAVILAGRLDHAVPQTGTAHMNGAQRVDHPMRSGEGPDSRLP